MFSALDFSACACMDARYLFECARIIIALTRGSDHEPQSENWMEIYARAVIMQKPNLANSRALYVIYTILKNA